MADYIEGKRPVIEALRAQMPLISELMADNVQQDSQIKDILRKAKQYDVPVKTVPRKVLDERSERGNHQGVMAHAKPHQYSSVTDILKIAERDAERTMAPRSWCCSITLPMGATLAPSRVRLT